MTNTMSLNSSNTGKCNLDAALPAVPKEMSYLKITCKNESKEPVWKCRYLITLVGFLIFLFSEIQKTILSVLIVAMVNHTAIDQFSKVKSESCLQLMNFTEHGTSRIIQREGELIWSPQIQGYIFGLYNVGLVVIQLPSTRLSEKYGCRWFIVVSLLTMGVLTILLPPLSWWTVYAVMVIQTFRGFGEGAAKACTSVIIANWCPKNERGFSFSIVVSGVYLGQVLGYIFAGYVSEVPGRWPYVYYSVGASVTALGIYFLIFIVENPKDHPRISRAELNYILSNQETVLTKKRPKFPWRRILTSVPTYALMAASIARFWGVSQFAIVHSTFLGTILHYPMGQNGLFSALPNLVSFVLSQVSSLITLYVQKKNIVSVDFLRKFWTLVSHLGYSLCIFGMYIAGCNRNLSVVFAILSMGSIGLGTVGSLVVAQDMSPTFAATLISICYTIGCISGVILPLIVGYLTDEMRTLEQWDKVFFISIAVVMSTTIIFVIFGSAKVQPWNFVQDENKNKDEMTDEKKHENSSNDKMTKL